jgi:hypothetical protein
MPKFPKSLVFDLVIIAAIVFAVDRPGSHGEARAHAETLRLLIEFGWVFGVGRLASESLTFLLSPPIALRSSRARFAGLHVSIRQSYALLFRLGASHLKRAGGTSGALRAALLLAAMAGPLFALRLSNLADGRPAADYAGLAYLCGSAALALASLALVSLAEARVRHSREQLLLSIDTPEFHDRWSDMDAQREAALEARTLSGASRQPVEKNSGPKQGRPRL